jgi:hypothetical protein
VTSQEITRGLGLGRDMPNIAKPLTILEMSQAHLTKKLRVAR